MPNVKDVEKTVKECYSTWSGNYYDNYYGNKASYPPVHKDLLKRLLIESRVRNVLDAGCGPASFLRELAGERIDLFGFDLTPEMVTEARRVLLPLGVPGKQVWQGSVLSRKSFRPAAFGTKRYDAAVCVGVFPHIPEDADILAMTNLRDAVKKGGLVIVEARNQLFSLFTQNRYSYEFLVNDLIRLRELKKKIPAAQSAKMSKMLRDFQKHFRMDLPPVRKGNAGKPGYDEIISRTHNPLVLREQFAGVGFKDVRVLFYHFHCLPPMLQKEIPRIFLKESLAMEDPGDWRGYFMSSAFLVLGRRA